ncbi:uncharacterized protein BDR25DRAFT_382126 [Lindgomyces ingoldianus]|uniref:Uncharacterized protein n=1 Tax=Lindgomyces ingoldianus TaxID=673940 RepID=A0ACB6RAA0_9PLEO|nr:uncharacterized protein BDR25DRAFT_382126 [Lindgomyces ingoldianus]KAF2475252.1 hypothetical protein BDR25DRAFT_382126 [Lindgomyces ingoldianus]
MADPLSAAGLVLATLTLPAQAFSSCVLAYNTISDIGATGKQLSTTFWLFKLQLTRFLVWGQNSDIYRDGVTPEKLSQPVYEMVVSTLMQITDLLQDVSKLRSYYGLLRIPEPNMDESRISRREINRQATLVFRVQKSCSLFRRLKWAVHDNVRFASLVQQLTQFNDALYQFSPLIQGSSQTAAVDAEALALAIVNDGWQGVQALQQALATTQHPAPSGLQTLGNGELASLSAAFIRGTQVSAAESGPNPPLAQFTPARNLYMDYRRFQILGLKNDTPQRRSWAQLPGYPGHGPTQVVLEWRPYNPRTVSGPFKNALQLRVEALTRMLQEGPKPPGFRILDCLGYLEDNSSARFGIVFRYPQPHMQEQGSYVPKTLFQIIHQQNFPYLGDRFKLAGFLSESLYELHASRWLHKSINSHNVLFFHQPNTGNSHTQEQSTNPALPLPLAHPFFTGFALARPDDPGAQSDNMFPDLDTGIYRHPDVQGLAGAPISPYHSIYDIYSLGAILLEIGTWCTLKSFYQHGQNGNAFRERLLERKVSLLGVSMGQKYMDAVRKCLSGSFDGMQQFQDHERDTPDYVVNLHRSFYWEVVKVLKECRL